MTEPLAVACYAAVVPRRTFVFLGVAGVVLVAMLAAYAGIAHPGAHCREKATPRVRWARRRYLRSMLTMRVSIITAAGAGGGDALGSSISATVIGHRALTRAAAGTLVTLAVLGTVAALLATGAALYVIGHRSIERDINAISKKRRPDSGRHLRCGDGIVSTW